MIVGMDFGTTNSGMAVTREGQVTLLPLDPTNANPRVMRTALYVTNELQIVAGRAAVDRYFADNIGRPIRLQRVWVGEIEVIASEVYYVEDLYVWMDTLSPGRLFLSMKSGLRDESYTGTVIGQFYFSLEDLVTLFLTITRTRAARLLECEVQQVVLGRPVRFAFDPEHDALAQQRLLTAAFRAGYETVYLQYEPIAAAAAYSETLTAAENILVFDFGGGTLDTTVMRLEPGAAPRVLATGGIPVAGDRFDQKLSRARLPRHFGEGTRYGPREQPLPVPAWIYDVFSDWQGMINLQRPDNRRILEEIAQTARHPSEIKALLSLVSSNYGLQLFDEVERAKRRLSEKVGATIRLEGPGFDVFDLVTRSKFERVIRHEIQAIEEHLDSVVADSGLQPAQIDVVIRTGGSSQIPVFQAMLRRKFATERQEALDTFSSVTQGLGRYAGQIEAGTASLVAYRAADLARAGTQAGETRVPQVNAALLQRRIQATEGASGGAIHLPDHALVLLGADGRVHPAPWPADGPAATLAALGWPADDGPTQALVLRPEARLLAMTSRYRFLLTPTAQLLELAAIGLRLQDLYHLRPGEQVQLVADWDALAARPWLVLITTLGWARAYDSTALAAQVDGPVPLQFDDPPPGWPAFVLGANRTEDLILATQSGRATRLPLARLPYAGAEVLRSGESDRLVGAVLVEGDGELLLVTAEGYARRLAAGSVPADERPGGRGRSVLARSNARSLAPVRPGERLWLISDARMFSGDFGSIPVDDSTRSYRLARVRDGETIAAIVGAPANEKATRDGVAEG